MRLASCLIWPIKSAGHFVRDDRGSITVFSLVLLVAMVGIGGLALDTMRYEQQRVMVQNALDRCTLMAASLKQRLDPEDVVYDCMANSGLRSTVKSVDVSDVTSGGTVNARTVVAVAETDINTLFPNAMGVRTLNVDARSTATQKLSKIEISLVLDVSTSMDGDKLTNLKTAAKEFVATVLNNDSDKRISINLVPFSSQVNLRPALRNLYNATDVHNQANVNCFDMPDSVYEALEFSRTLAMPMTGNVDANSTTSTQTVFVHPTDVSFAIPRTYNAPLLPGFNRIDNRDCPAMPGNVVRVGQQTISTLQTQIDGLVAAGNTSVAAGLRWGITLLDPGSQSVFTALRTANEAPSTVAGRPFAYNDQDALKIIVVMSDGSNSQAASLNPGFRTGLSPIWRANDGLYSIRHQAQTSDNKFYVPLTNTWRATAYAPTGGSATQQTWQQVWAAMRMSYVWRQFYFRAFPTDPAFNEVNVFNMFRTVTSGSKLDTQQAAMCNLAKAQNVIIYSIAFEVIGNGKAALSNCASSPAHFFDAAGTQISSAFRMIATNITQLKLTQ